MKWPVAVMLAAGALVGCRSSQPAANPFIRTTVPPPGTGSGAVVVPGEQYYPSGAAPVGAPAAVASPAPMVVPGAPPPVLAPPPGSPPAIIPPRDKYSPPGGSFQYNQSSNEPGKSPVAASPETALAEEEAGRTREEIAETPSDAVRQAVALAVDLDDAVPDTLDENQLTAREAIAADKRRDPPESVAVVDRDPRIADDVGRLLRGSVQETDNQAAELAVDEESEPLAEASAPRLLRQPAASAAAALEPLPEEVADSAEEIQPHRPTVAQVEPAPPDEPQVPPTTIKLVTARSPVRDPEPVTSAAPIAAPAADVQARASAARGAEGSGEADYAYADDYGSLRGRLEYSHGLRQWKLRYIPIDGATDSYGGSVVLPTSDAVSRFQPGDRVTARGSLAGKSSGPGSFSPLYQLDSIEPLAR